MPVLLRSGPSRHRREVTASTLALYTRVDRTAICTASPKDAALELVLDRLIS